MQIDWTTFVLQIVNFLVLLWILTRFLYRPVLDVLARRRAGIERTLTQARETEARAAALRTQFEGRLAEWEEEKAAARARLEAELAAERLRRMQALERALAEERERVAAQEAHRREEMLHELEARAVEQARRFATRLLSRLADPRLEARLIEIFVEELAGLPEEPLTGLRAAAQPPQTHATVTSAYPLDEDQRSRVRDALAARLGHALPVEFGQDQKLLAGLRVSVGPWQLGLSLADELAAFAAAANHGE